MGGEEGVCVGGWVWGGVLNAGGRGGGGVNRTKGCGGASCRMGGAPN